MLSNFLIGLREGFEAALIVSILVAYLVKLDRKKDVSKIFVGVATAIAISLAAAIVLGAVNEEVSETTEVLLSGTFSFIAVAFVTWMIFWMAKQGRFLAKDLHGKIDRAIQASAWSLAVVAFLAVIREGLETAIFIWTTSRATDGTLPALGAVFGLIAAGVLGILVYRGAVKLNLSSFFKYTGAFLVVVTAGIASYGVHEFQELHLLPFLENVAYDLTPLIPEGSLLEVILKGTLVYRGNPSMLEVVVWLSFISVVGTLYAKQYSVRDAKAKVNA